MYPNEYLDPLKRRFQPDAQLPAVQQPQPLMAQQVVPGPQQPMQWQPMPEQDQQQDAGTAGTGLASLLKRFQKPDGKSNLAVGGFEGKG